jgi:hypothetical protein
MGTREPRKKHPEVCGLGGCYNRKVRAGLFCSTHWPLVSTETQKKYCELMLSGPRDDVTLQRQMDALEFDALAQIGRYLEAHPSKKKGA